MKGQLFCAFLTTGLAMNALADTQTNTLLGHEVVAIYRFEGTTADLTSEWFGVNPLKYWRTPTAASDDERGTFVRFYQAANGSAQDSQKTQQLLGRGANDTYSIENAPVGNETFSIALWLKVESLEGSARLNNEVVFGFGESVDSKAAFLRLQRDGANGGYLMYTNWGNNRFFGGSDLMSGWHHYCFVNGSDGKAKIYVDGVFKIETAAKTRNISTTAAFQLGYGGKFGNSSSLNGCMDDFVFVKGELTAEEVVQVKNNLSTLLSSDDTTAIELGIPSLTAAEDGSVVISTTATKGSGTVVARATRLVDETNIDTTITTELAVPEGDSQALSGTLTGFDTDTMYGFSVQGMSTGGTATQRDGSYNFYTGALSVAAGTDADESTLSYGTYTISRANTPAATTGDLVVYYTLSGGEGTYDPPTGSVVITNGADSAVVSIRAAYNDEVQEDAQVTLTLAEGPYLVDASTRSATIRVINSDLLQTDRYVSPTGNDNNDGLTPETAKAKVSAAIASLAAFTDIPTTIHVAPGTYQGGVGKVTNPITIVGEGDDPSAVVFKGWGLGGRSQLLTLNHAGARICNVTLREGCAYQTGAPGGANLCIGSNGGTASNCVITTGYADNYNGHGGNASILNGLITHCVISNGVVNEVGSQKKAGCLEMYGGRVENCLIVGNADTATGEEVSHAMVAGVYIQDGTLRNCTVAANNGQATGGVYVNKVSGLNPSVENCIIVGNSASLEGGFAAWRTSDATMNAVFKNCIVDSADLPSATCRSATKEQVFMDFANGDYHLSKHSPAINRGACKEDGTDAAGDLDLVQRIKGRTIDVGCYEANPPSMIITVR